MNACFSCKWVDSKPACPFMSQAKMYPMIGCETMYLEKK